METRAVRYRCELEAELSPEGESFVPARAIEVSATGAFLVTDADLQMGDRATLKLQLPGGPPWVAPVLVSRAGIGHEEVRRPGLEPLVVARNGVAVEFTEVPPLERRRLEGYMELLDEE